MILTYLLVHKKKTDSLVIVPLFSFLSFYSAYPGLLSTFSARYKCILFPISVLFSLVGLGQGRLRQRRTVTPSGEPTQSGPAKETRQEAAEPRTEGTDKREEVVSSAGSGAEDRRDGRKKRGGFFLGNTRSSLGAGKRIKRSQESSSGVINNHLLAFHL
jgi:hypothetical protein